MHKVLSEWKIGKYTILELNQETPMKPYHKYCIDGVYYEIVPVYDMPRCIAIEAHDSYVGKAVEFV